MELPPSRYKKRAADWQYATESVGNELMLCVFQPRAVFTKESSFAAIAVPVAGVAPDTRSAITVTDRCLKIAIHRLWS
jgi:hypothetical protein